MDRIRKLADKTQYVTDRMRILVDSLLFLLDSYALCNLDDPINCLNTIIHLKSNCKIVEFIENCPASFYNQNTVLL